MKTVRGNSVAVLGITRLAYCQYEHCRAKTRIFLAFPVSDSEGLVGFRVCGQHVETVIESYRTSP